MGGGAFENMPEEQGKFVPYHDTIQLARVGQTMTKILVPVLTASELLSAGVAAKMDEPYAEHLISAGEITVSGAVFIVALGGIQRYCENLRDRQ